MRTNPMLGEGRASHELQGREGARGVGLGRRSWDDGTRGSRGNNCGYCCSLHLRSSFPSSTLMRRYPPVVIRARLVSPLRPYAVLTYRRMLRTLMDADQAKRFDAFSAVVIPKGPITRVSERSEACRFLVLSSSLRGFLDFDVFVSSSNMGHDAHRPLDQPALGHPGHLPSRSASQSDDT